MSIFLRGGKKKKEVSLQMFNKSTENAAWQLEEETCEWHQDICVDSKGRTKRTSCAQFLKTLARALSDSLDPGEHMHMKQILQKPCFTDSGQESRRPFEKELKFTAWVYPYSGECFPCKFTGSYIQVFSYWFFWLNLLYSSSGFYVCPCSHVLSITSPTGRLKCLMWWDRERPKGQSMHVQEYKARSLTQLVLVQLIPPHSTRKMMWLFIFYSHGSWSVQILAQTLFWTYLWGSFWRRVTCESLE